MMRLLYCLACCLPVLAQASELTDAIHNRVHQAEVLRGHFVQTKTLAGFSKPLIARGSFVVSRSRGILWQTDTPFPGLLRLTRGEILQKSGDTVTLKMDAGKEPALRAINNLLFAVLAGDITQLDGIFQLSGEGKSHPWQLLMLPKDSGVAQVLRQVKLQGDSHVEHVDMIDANGDLTRIDFSDTREDHALTADEEHRFE